MAEASIGNNREPADVCGVRHFELPWLVASSPQDENASRGGRFPGRAARATTERSGQAKCRPAVRRRLELELGRGTGCDDLQIEAGAGSVQQACQLARGKSLWSTPFRCQSRGHRINTVGRAESACAGTPAWSAWYRF